MNTSNYKFISGGMAQDQRGKIRFVNDFDMTAVRRFYLISNSNLDTIRGWRGHKIEQRWFYAVSGQFLIRLVKIDHWEQPSAFLTIEEVVLDASEGSVLHIPAGYATAVQATETQSEMLVFADYAITHAMKDDFTWPSDYFRGNK